MPGTGADKRGALTLDEAMAFLHQIEDGELTLDGVPRPQAVFVGLIRYTASNGWTIVVYNDANDWDYVDHIETTGGRMLSSEDAMTIFDQYSPSDEIAWTRYRIPGYCRLRCEACGHDIHGRPRGEPRTYTCCGCGGVHELKDPEADG